MTFPNRGRGSLARVVGRGEGGRGGPPALSARAPLPVNHLLRRQPRGFPDSVPGGGGSSSRSNRRRRRAPCTGEPSLPTQPGDSRPGGGSGAALKSSRRAGSQDLPGGTRCGARGSSKHSGAQTAACGARGARPSVTGVGSSGEAMGERRRVGPVSAPSEAGGKPGPHSGGQPPSLVLTSTALSLVGGSSFFLMKQHH